jgi:HEAT repeat protein
MGVSNMGVDDAQYGTIAEMLEKGETSEARCGAAEALGFIAGGRAVAALRKASESDPDRKVRKTAAGILEWIPDMDATNTTPGKTAN